MPRRACTECKRRCDGALRTQYNIAADHGPNGQRNTTTHYFCGYYCLAAWARKRYDGGSID